MAKGLYDDGWVQPYLVVQSTGGEQGKMKLSLYLANVIREGDVEICIDGENIATVPLHHEMNAIEVETPVGQLFTWELKFAEYINPKRMGEDIRDLSAIITRIELA